MSREGDLGSREGDLGCIVKFASESVQLRSRHYIARATFLCAPVAVLEKEILPQIEFDTAMETARGEPHWSHDLRLVLWVSRHLMMRKT